MNNSKIVVGNPNGVRISFSWDEEKPCGTASQATWGRCNLWIGDRLVWGHENPENMLAEGVHWDWIELLEFLVSSWHYLVYEETYPVNLNPSHPGKLRTLASRRWETMSKSLSLRFRKVKRKIFGRRIDLTTHLNV